MEKKTENEMEQIRRGLEQFLEHEVDGLGESVRPEDERELFSEGQGEESLAEEEEGDVFLPEEEDDLPEDDGDDLSENNGDDFPEGDGENFPEEDEDIFQEEESDRASFLKKESGIERREKRRADRSEGKRGENRTERKENRTERKAEKRDMGEGKKKKKTILTDTQIQEIKRIYNAWQSADPDLYTDVAELCRSVKILKKDKRNPDDITIEDKDFSLSLSKYIEFIDHDLDIDYAKEMARIQDEMRLLMVSEELSQSMLKDAFRGIGYGID